MAIKKYIGARYAPKFMGAWDKASEYSALSVVYTNNQSYVSRKTVPANTEITNTEFWIKSADWNAQVEQYNQHVEQYNQNVERYNQNVETYNTNVDNFFDATIHAYNTKEEMVNDTTIQPEYTLITCGANTVGDGGGSLYKVASSTSATAVALKNGLFAVPFNFNIDNFDEQYREASSLKNRKIICFGDSWGINTDNYTGWATALMKVTGATVTNYCVSGAGYTKDGALSFLNQVDTAAVDNNATDIILIGGFNDIASENTDAISPVLEKIITKYPNAKVWVSMNGCGPTYDLTGLNGFKRWLRAISNTVTLYTVNYMPDTFMCGFMSTTACQGHPNTESHKKIAHVISSYLSGGTPHIVYYFADPVTYNTDEYINDKSETNVATLSGGYITITTGILTLNLRNHSTTVPGQLGTIISPLNTGAIPYRTTATIALHYTDGTYDFSTVTLSFNCDGTVTMPGFENTSGKTVTKIVINGTTFTAHLFN